MNNLKTAFVVVVLLAVLYGVYVVLNKPEQAPSADAGNAPWPKAPGHAPEIFSGTPVPPPGALGAPNTTPPSATSTPYQGPSTSVLPGPDRTAPLDVFPLEEGTNSPSPDAGAVYRYGDGYAEPQRVPDLDRVHPSAPQGPPSRGDDSFADRPYEQPSDAETPDRPAARPPDRSLGSSAFAAYWETAQQQIRDRQYRQALATLTPFYGSSDLSADEQKQLEDLLDPLAGKVIYSTDHLMEDPYVPHRGETLREIAAAHEVPWELLQNINGIEDPNVIAPGVELKVMRGPFRAEVELAHHRLTLFVGNLYAGRFDIEVHEKGAPLVGKFLVQQRRQWPEFESAGQSIDPNHPDNPYGQWLLDLGGGVKLHSSSPSPATAALGCISMSPRDASDVYGILSEGSRVEIRR